MFILRSAVNVRVRASPQKINLRLCDVPKSDLNHLVCVHACVHEIIMVLSAGSLTVMRHSGICLFTADPLMRTGAGASLGFYLQHNLMFINGYYTSSTEKHQTQVSLKNMTLTQNIKQTF